MAKSKINLPMSQGGLRSFGESGFNKLKFDPDKVMQSETIMIARDSVYFLIIIDF